ncbi:pyridoxal-phosphate dependent enzyme [Undibacterium amnicola]|uniref:Pyridoxal-phosphate dependent enzyme n=1 Tax=Undibacterium amnicola TaxID=1834038 RepID=A0ABR6XNJ5_9BURK|nr:pyridoxal-phosphate dependent enzyme [Undibacterium amnicola]MBC3830574.1 pyridoxal-phosphate dependent enzyme [Undibacterium amnicola]
MLISENFCFSDIEAAHQRILPHIQATPVLTSSTANQLSGARLFFKCENFQMTGAFKFRGACNALLQFTTEQQARGVVTFSSGNHAQAIAKAAQRLGMRAVIVMPQDAPAIKVAATRAYGGEVVLYDRYTEDREQIGRRLAEDQGLTLIPPYDHPHVIGVEPEAGNDGQRSFRSGSIVHIDTPNTIADGAQTQHLGQHTFPVIQRYVDDVMTVSDAQLIDTMKFFASRMKIMVEPTGCLGAALAMSKQIDLRDLKVGVLVSGGNVDLARFAGFVQSTEK